MIKHLINRKIGTRTYLGLLFLWGILAFSAGCAQPPQAQPSDSFPFPYTLSQATAQFDLSDRLTEISGLCLYDSSHLLAIQDEAGIIFMIAMDRGELVREVPFGKARDYEGVALKDPQTLFVLESDGDIFHIQHFDTDSQRVEKYETVLSREEDTEGLCYDGAGDRLLVALKESPGGTVEEHEAALFAFDLKQMKMDEVPAFIIDRYEVGTWVYEERKKKKLKPSGLAIHPRTGNLYVIASVGKMLLVLSPEGRLLHAERLDKDLFEQPEGIAFDLHGNLYIASEGEDGPGKLMKFKMK
jgi:uncharacterized protein YjiK